MIQNFPYAGHSGVVAREGGGRTIRFVPQPRPRAGRVRRRIAPPAAVPRGGQRAARRRRFRPAVREERQDRVEEWRKQQAPARRAGAARSVPAGGGACAAPTATRPCRPTSIAITRRLVPRYWGAPQLLATTSHKHDPDLWRQLHAVRPGHHRRRRRRVLRVLLAKTNRPTGTCPSRGGRFGPSPSLQLGTTNVDYSPRPLRAVPDAADLPPDPVQPRPAGLRREECRAWRTTARRRSTCRRAGCAGS